MISNDHGAGFFFWDNYARYDYLDENMKADCQKINSEYSFFDFVMANNGGYFSRDEMLCWFHSTWRFIPKDMLYETYKELLDDTNWAKGLWAYSYFFKVGLYRDIMTLNKHDTVNNSVLHPLLDESGFITIYRGYSKYALYGPNTLNTPYSWTFNKKNAIRDGCHYAICDNHPHFNCLTGKARLEDVITFIDGHIIHEITILPSLVNIQLKEVFNTNDFR